MQGKAIDPAGRGSRDVGRAGAADRGRDPRQGRHGLSRSQPHVDDLRECSYESARHRRDRHERPADQCRSHRQQHRQHQHDRLTSARAPNSPTCSTRSTACRACRTAPTDLADAGRRQHRPRRQDRRRSATLHIQGALTQTGNKLRPGAQRPRLVSDRRAPNGETLYTRAGAFNTNANGQLVTADGYLVHPGDHDAARSGRGHRQQDRPGVCPHRYGKIDLAAARPARRSPTSPTKRASSRSAATSIQETAGVRPASVGVPGDPGFGNIHQGYLERLQRRSGQGNHRADLGAARLRDELQGHPGGRRNGSARSRRACASSVPSMSDSGGLCRHAALACRAAGLCCRRCAALRAEELSCRCRGSRSIPASHPGRACSPSAPSSPTPSRRADVIDGREALVGKVARRTLLPGQPIPSDAVRGSVRGSRRRKIGQGRLRGRRPDDRHQRARPAERARRRPRPGPQHRQRRDHQGDGRPAGRHRPGRGRIMMRRFLLRARPALLPAGWRPGGRRASRTSCPCKGVRDNQLVGYGLVIGLNGTGDTLRNSPFTEQSLQSMLDHMGINVRNTKARAPQRRGRHRHRRAAGLRSARARASTSPCRRSAMPRRCAAARWC